MRLEDLAEKLRGLGAVEALANLRLRSLDAFGWSLQVLGPTVQVSWL